MCWGTWVQTRTDRLDLCKIHIEMERNMTETGLWIFLICLLVVVIIATVVAVVSAVSVLRQRSWMMRNQRKSRNTAGIREKLLSVLYRCIADRGFFVHRILP